MPIRFPKMGGSWGVGPLDNSHQSGIKETRSKKSTLQTKTKEKTKAAAKTPMDTHLLGGRASSSSKVQLRSPSQLSLSGGSESTLHDRTDSVASNSLSVESTDLNPVEPQLDHSLPINAQAEALKKEVMTAAKPARQEADSPLDLSALKKEYNDLQIAYKVALYSGDNEGLKDVSKRIKTIEEKIDHIVEHNKKTEIENQGITKENEKIKKDNEEIDKRIRKFDGPDGYIAKVQNVITAELDKLEAEKKLKQAEEELTQATKEKANYFSFRGQFSSPPTGIAAVGAFLNALGRGLFVVPYRNIRWQLNLGTERKKVEERTKNIEGLKVNIEKSKNDYINKNDKVTEKRGLAQQVMEKLKQNPNLPLPENFRKSDRLKVIEALQKTRADLLAKKKEIIPLKTVIQQGELLPPNNRTETAKKFVNEIFGTEEAFQKIPVLKLEEPTQYDLGTDIDFIKPESMPNSVMRGVDSLGRAFLAVKMKDTRGDLRVQVFHEKLDEFQGEWEWKASGDEVIPFETRIYYCNGEVAEVTGFQYLDGEFRSQNYASFATLKELIAHGPKSGRHDHVYAYKYKYVKNAIPSPRDCPIARLGMSEKIRVELAGSSKSDR